MQCSHTRLACMLCHTVWYKFTGLSHSWYIHPLSQRWKQQAHLEQWRLHLKLYTVSNRIYVTCLFMCILVLPKYCLGKKLWNKNHLPYILQNFEPFYYGCTNSRHQVAMATKFCTVVSNIFGSSVWNLLHVTFLVSSRIMKWLLNFWKICAPMMMTISITIIPLPLFFFFFCTVQSVKW